MHPCPYCSCDKVAVERTVEGGAVVACGNCGMSGPESVDGSEDEAIRGWELLCRKMCRNCRQVYIERLRALRKELEETSVGILKSRKEIAEAFGVSPNTVTRWAEQGAPIAVVGRYKADRSELMAWLVEYSRGKSACLLKPDSLFSQKDGCTHRQSQATKS